MLYQKREDINNILIERLNSRRDLEVNDRDELEYFGRLCSEQFSIIKSQKVNIENIDKLILEITEAENRLEELDVANSRDEIVSLLDEFAVAKQEIEKIEMPVEEEIQEGVIKENNERKSDKPGNMVVRIQEPVKLDVKAATDTAKLVMKKVVIVLEPKKFNTKKDKLAEAEKELQKEKEQDEMFVTLDVNNDTKDVSDDIFVTDNDDEIKVDIGEAVIPTEIFIDEPKEEKLELFSEQDPFLDDNEYELKDGEKREETVTDMPKVDNIGTVRPTSMLSKIEEVTEANNDIILPTMGLSNSENVDVPIVSENYIQ